jgi:hypothetical protein
MKQSALLRAGSFLGVRIPDQKIQALPFFTAGVELGRRVSVWRRTRSCFRAVHCAADRK